MTFVNSRGVIGKLITRGVARVLPSRDISHGEPRAATDIPGTLTLFRPGEKEGGKMPSLTRLTNRPTVEENWRTRVSTE